jgi:RNA polymerase sigma-70 factor, ECF subfamily
MIWEEFYPENCRAETDSVAIERKEHVCTITEVAFRAFYEKTAQPLRSYLFRISGDVSLADDLLQESFYRFLRVPGLHQDENQMKAYLYKIATHLMTDHWRRLRRERRWFRRTESGEVDEIEVIADLGDLGREVILSHDISKVFQKVRLRERALLWLAYVEGAGHREIAEALQVKEKSVRVMLFRTRQKLAELLRQSGMGPEVKS